MKNPASHRSSETNMTPQKLVQRSFVALFAVLLLLLGSSTAALAHDEVTGTTPANDATVTNVPDTIEVSFTNTPAAIGSFIEVLDESGTNWAAGDVQVLGRMATQAVNPGAPAGKFIVKWRLVSSDTHPVEGEFTFTATSAATSTAAAIVGAGLLFRFRLSRRSPRKRCAMTVPCRGASSASASCWWVWSWPCSWWLVAAWGKIARRYAIARAGLNSRESTLLAMD
ncbi:copper resistance CopC family protein [Arthrobacter psychrolactophilus]